MKKAYVTYNEFNEEAKKILKNAEIELTINDSNHRPSGDELISILENYDSFYI